MANGIYFRCLNLKQNTLGIQKHDLDLQYNPYEKLVEELLLRGAIYLVLVWGYVLCYGCSERSSHGIIYDILSYILLYYFKN